jgi:simple sugar transport system permease protein
MGAGLRAGTVDLLRAVVDVLTSETAWTSAVRFAAVLAFAAVGEWIAERAGTLNISVEGMMLAGAFAAATGMDASSSVAVGLLVGVVGGVLVAGVQAEMSHRLTADPFVVGLTLNILVLGLVGYLAGVRDPVSDTAAVVEVPLLSDLPLVGRALFAQPWPFYLLYLVVPAAFRVVHRTRWGLEVRAVGEDPQAADVSGVDVLRRRRQAVLLCGACAGLGGAYLLLGQVGRFDEGMVSGRGFIAIVAVIFGGWTLRGTILGCLLFGSVLSFRLSLPALGYELNVELLSSLPFVVTIAAMAVYARRVRRPAALGQPFVRGLR